MVTVPLYDTLGPEACSYIIHQGFNTILTYLPTYLYIKNRKPVSAEIRVVVCDRAHKAELLVEKRHTCPSLQCIILVETPTDALLQKAANSGVEITSYEEVQKLGIAARNKLPPLQPMVGIAIIHFVH